MARHDNDAELDGSALMALNCVSPYYTMFPLDFPLRVLRTAKADDWVLDPFCGRGTTNYAARMLGLVSVGVDVSPVAAAISQAKMSAATPAKIVRICEDILEKQPRSQDVPTGEFWESCYDGETLSDLCRLRDALRSDTRSSVRKALRGVLLGRLHGPRTKIAAPSYFSNQMPRTYAPKPDYSVRYWRKHRLRPPRVHVLEVVRRAAERYFSNTPKEVQSAIVMADSRGVHLQHLIDSLSRSEGSRIRWVVTSPPYVGMRTYVADQWLRHWFVGGGSSVDYSCGTQLGTASVGDFVVNLSEVWRNIVGSCDDGTRMIVRIGGLPHKAGTPRQLLCESLALANCGWRVVTAKSAGRAKSHNRQASQFFKKPRRQVEEYDVYAVLG
jgi:hypothetical protein